jgi:hypothetical protein
MHRYNALPRNVFLSLPVGRQWRWLAHVVDIFDSVLSWALNPFCQNYACVLQRKV